MIIQEEVFNISSLYKKIKLINTSNLSIDILTNIVLFLSDRTCCVCRKPNLDVQIHHIDKKNQNYDFDNLASLCLEDHNKTLKKGGFGRALNPDLIKMYRNEWYFLVNKKWNRSKLYIMVDS